MLTLEKRLMILPSIFTAISFIHSIRKISRPITLCDIVFTKTHFYQLGACKEPESKSRGCSTVWISCLLKQLYLIPFATGTVLALGQPCAFSLAVPKNNVRSWTSLHRQQVQANVVVCCSDPELFVEVFVRFSIQCLMDISWFDGAHVCSALS